MTLQVQTRTQIMVAEYPGYDEAVRAVDYLADRKYPIEHLTVVGCDLRLVETVTGRLNWGRAAIGGLATGAWIGGFVGLLLAIWAASTSDALRVVVGSAGYGAIFGLLFGLLAYALTGGRHDYLSRSQIVPRKFELLADADYAERASSTLRDLH